MGIELRPGDRGVNIRVDEPAWAPRSVFGAVMTARHEHDTFTAIERWGYFDSARTDRHRHDEAVERDRRLVKHARRWSGSPLQPPAHGVFVAGDVAAIRIAALENDLAHRNEMRLQRIEGGATIDRSGMEARSIGLDASVSHWLYEAVPYFLPSATVAAMASSTALDPEDLSDLTLPHRDIAIYFGGDLEMPAELLDNDDSIRQLAERYAPHLEADIVDGDHKPATVISTALHRIASNQPVSICGVVLHADEHGRLDNTVMWLTSNPSEPTPNRDVIYGNLAHSTLRYVAINLAAVVAWGDWTNPALDTELGATTDPNFRRTIRTSKFRKQEPAGGAIGVQVLYVKRTTKQPRTSSTGTHASPAEHPRRPHWKRVRVGPRDDWHYERRLIDFTIVNPGHTSTQLTVRRLPPPPDRTDLDVG